MSRIGIETKDALAQIVAATAKWGELANFARCSDRGVRGAALMSVARRFPDEPRTVALLEELATSPSRNDVLMGVATVGHVCLLLLRDMHSDAASGAFSRLHEAWDSDDRANMEFVLSKGL